jgi:protein-L-isoaspartate(D-aspartate) O-methyltransferase
VRSTAEAVAIISKNADKWAVFMPFVNAGKYKNVYIITKCMDRAGLVEYLASVGAIRTKKVADAMLAVPRESFVPGQYRNLAYEDIPLPIGAGQTISAPHMVAMMTEFLDVSDGMNVLEIGTGSGYQAAILSHIINRNGKIYTMEIAGELAERARENLEGYKNVETVTGDGSLGLPEHAPYDRILVTCGCPEIPAPLLGQLKSGGKLVAPVGGYLEQRLVLASKNREIRMADLGVPCMFVPLVGKAGWKHA